MHSAATPIPAYLANSRVHLRCGVHQDAVVVVAERQLLVMLVPVAQDEGRVPEVLAEEPQPMASETQVPVAQVNLELLK
jgi:hypothetical protein